MKTLKGIAQVLALTVSLSASAQKIKLLTSENQLSNSLINQICQTNDGYVWIATEDGLNRYDGQTVNVYRTSDEDNSLSSNYVQRLFEDSRGRLWVGCINGLQLYDKESDSFRHLPMVVAKGDTVSPHVTGIAEDASGQIWISTSGRGLMKVDDGVAHAITRFIGIEQMDFISSILIDSSDRLWIVANKNGVLRCNVGTGEAARVRIDGDRAMAENSIVSESLGRVFLNVLGDLYVFDESTNAFRSSGFAPEVGQYVVSAIGTNKDQTLIGTDGNGLFAFDFERQHTERIELYAPQIEFEKAKIHSIVSDFDGNMWLGLFQKGVMTVLHSSEGVVNFGFRPDGKYNIGSGCVTAIRCIGHDTWIGIDSDGLYRVNDNGTAEHISAPVPQTIMGIEPAANGGVWLAAYNGGLVHYDGKSKVTDQNAGIFAANPKFNNRSTALAIDEEGYIWVGSFGNGLFRVAKDGSATNFASSSETIDYGRNEPVNNWINAIYPDGKYLWIGTYRGLSLFGTDDNSFAAPEGELLAAVEQSVVYAIAKSADNKLWIGTDKGLIAYDFASHKATTLNSDNGLITNIIVSLMPDNEGHIWAGSYGGLSCVNTATLAVENFTASNGLQGNEFSRAAADTDDQGRLYFGGTNGVSRFVPSAMQAKVDTLRLALTKFYLNGTRVDNNHADNDDISITRNADGTNTYRFSASEKSFTAEFSTFNFANPENVVLEYRLSDYDNTWRSTKPGASQISFTNLPHNNYTLEVVATLGSSRSRVLCIGLEITPRWWQTPWAYAAYVLIMVLIALAISLVTKSRQAIRAELMKHEHERDIDEAKFQFYFNISHEIRTPLTLILNPIRELMDNQSASEKDQKNYRLIQQNATRILRLINQLLDMRKIEKGQMKMSFCSVRFKQFFEQIEESFASVREKKHLSTSIVSKMSDDLVDIDPNNFDKVIYNVYSNAFKFTPDDGSINTLLTEDGDNVIISISDTGTGISPELREKIFDRFYQGSVSEQSSFAGTGIGLHLSRSIVELHGGSIVATANAEGLGTTMIITIPRKHADSVMAPEQRPIDTLYSSASIDDDAQESTPRPRPTTNKRILIVDDETEVNNYLTEKLSRFYKVVACNNGREAYELLLRDTFDLVITDVMMPEMDGLTLCRKIKTNININHIPVILLTAKHSDEDRNIGLLTGADAYIAKPFDTEHLASTIATILANRDRILSHVSEASGQAPTIRRVEMKSSDEALIEKVTQYIEENIADPRLNVERLAEHVGMSRVHMHRKLKELTNQSARDYIRNIRLRQAGILLGEKKLNISEVAFALGFSNLSHFSTSFKDFYGISPKEYMNEHLGN